MSHPFGDLLTQHLHRKHGLSQAKLAASILQPPSIISEMCQGKRLQGRQARERVIAIIEWLQRRGALEHVSEANALLTAAGMAGLRASESQEAALLQQLEAQPVAFHRSPRTTAPTILPTAAPRFRGRSEENAKHNLPAQTTPLLGRVQELAELAHLLTDPTSRLVTILSAGGMGKTHLAVAAGLQQVAHFADGVCWVALAPLTDAQELASAIGTALGIHLRGGRTPEQQVADFLQTRHLLLVLDNFEHLLDGTPFISDLLQKASQLVILVTSRQRLKLSSETVVLLDGLRFPPAVNGDALTYPAVQMFVQHVRRHHPHHQPDEREIAGIVTICRLVAGMPLGILLAAAWSSVIATSEIGKDPGFLQSDLQDIPARQRNLRAVFLHTWHRLSADERTVFMRLSVFRGGATRAAAQVVTGATLAVLAALNDRALLWRLPGGRYEIHELLRQFAAEQLAEAEDNQAGSQQQAARAHSSYYLQLLSKQEQPIQGPEQRAAVDLLRADFENISVAWRWAVQQHEFSLLAPAIHALFLYCEVQGNFREGGILFADAAAELTSAASSPVRQSALRPLLGHVIVRQGACEFTVDNHKSAVTNLQEGLPYVTNDRERAFALAYLGNIALVRGERSVGWAALHESLALSRQCGDRSGVARALHMLNNGITEFAEGIALCEESLLLWRSVGRPDRIAHVLIDLAFQTCGLGDYEKAAAYCKESLEICATLGMQHSIAWILDTLGWTAWCQGDLANAQKYLQDSRDLYGVLVIPSGVAMTMAEQGLVLRSSGEVEQAVALARQAAAIVRDTDNQLVLAECLTFLGAALIGANDAAAAHSTLTEAIQRAWAGQITYYVVAAFYYFAELLVLESDAADLSGSLEYKDLAVTLLSCVRTQPATWQVFKDKAAQLQAEIEGALPAELRTAAIVRGQSCSLEELVKTLLSGLEAS